MSVDFRKELKARYDLITKTIEDIEKKNKTFPEGRINVRVHQQRSYYYLDGGGSKDRYLTQKDSDLIRQLIQKDYLNKVLKDAKTDRPRNMRKYTLKNPSTDGFNIVKSGEPGCFYWAAKNVPTSSWSMIFSKV